MKLFKVIFICILANLIVSCKVIEKTSAYEEQNYLASNIKSRVLAKISSSDTCTKDTNLARFFIELVNDSQINTKSLLKKIKHCIDEGANIHSRAGGITTMHLVIGYKLDTRDCRMQQDQSHPSCEGNDNYEKTMIEVLVEEGADINAKDTTFDEFIPLHTAVSYNYPAVKTLFDKGADPNAITKNGVSLLEYAITKFSSLDVIKQILTHPRFDKNVKNSKNEKESILTMAKKLSETGFYAQYDNMAKHLKDIVKLLEEYNMP